MKLFELLASANAKIDPGQIGINPVTNANNAITDALNTAYGAAGVVCVIVIVMGGYFYVTSGGDPSTAKRAREIILGAVVGIVVILMAFTITNFVLGRF